MQWLQLYYLAINISPVEPVIKNNIISHKRLGTIKFVPNLFYPVINMANIKLPTLKALIDNPSQFDTVDFGTKWMKIREYSRRDEYSKEKIKRLDMLFFKEADNSYYIYIEYPSSLHGNTYDVVIHFYTNDESIMGESTLRNYNVKIFSNNPVFGWFFGHANYTKGLIIPWLADKLSRDMLENVAVKHNPKDGIGFDHSFYLAATYILRHPRYLDKTYLESQLVAFNQSNIHAMVRPIDQTMEEFNTNKNKQSNKERFGKDKTLVEKAKDKFSDTASSVRSGIDKISRVINKPSTSGVHYVKPRKSNVTNKSKSGVRYIKARKSNRSK